ncbi:unnamed protein product [Durusdinium trenchii]|uniref:Uncharacterized protein n=2 Tax=Durusdinium trenchii TaxID=1381693 RepID=A0ABP0I2H8_9DINO
MPWTAAGCALAVAGAVGGDGWTLVSRSCHWHVHSPAEVHEKVTKPLWLAILGNSVMRGALQALVDQLVPEAWQSFAGTEDVPGIGTNIKCWGWLDFQVGDLRLSFQDYRIWFYTEEGIRVAFERLKRVILEGPDLLVIQHYGPDVSQGQPPLVYQPLLSETLPAYFKKKKKGKIIFALSKRSPFKVALCNPQCSDRKRPHLWNHSIEGLLAKLPQDLRSSTTGRILAVDEAFVCMPLFLDGETDVPQRQASQHWHRYDRSAGPGRKVFGTAADAAGHWYLTELLTMAGARSPGAGGAGGVGGVGVANLSAKACAQCPQKPCCPWQPVPVKINHSLSVVHDMPQIKSWADLTMQSCGQLI